MQTIQKRRREAKGISRNWKFSQLGLFVVFPRRRRVYIHLAAVLSSLVCREEERQQRKEGNKWYKRRKASFFDFLSSVISPTLPCSSPFPSAFWFFSSFLLSSPYSRDRSRQSTQKPPKNRVERNTFSFSSSSFSSLSSSLISPSKSIPSLSLAIEEEEEQSNNDASCYCYDYYSRLVYLSVYLCCR